ncbi:MAG TPA: hypothetical protein PKL31_10680 [Fulvivirga sp.]|nr:hypothetical protein [Fulvivirga sp.]
METITWKNSDLSGLRFDFETNAKSLGTLKVLSEFSSNASFTTDNDHLQFKNVGFWDRKVIIKKNGQPIGEIKNRIFGQTYIELKNGNKFRLSSNLIGRNLKWLGVNGQSIMEYKMATLNSMRKGFIGVGDSMTKYDKEILLSAGLIAGRFKTYRLLFGIMAIGSLLFLLDKLIW